MKRTLTFLALAGLTFSVTAATNTWDGLGDGTTYEDGANWGGTAPTDDLTTDVAQFTGGTVDLSTSRQVNGIDVITAGSTLTGGGSLEVGNGGMTGSQDFIINGGTIVDLNGSDSSYNYTGNMTIGAGSKVVSQRFAFDLDTTAHANTTVTLDGGEISAAGDHIEMFGRNIVLTSNGGTLRHSHARNMYGFGGTVGNNISGVGQLTIAGGGSASTAGRMQLDSVNTYSGGTRIIEGGQAWMYNNDSLGTGDITMDSGGTIYAVNHVNLGSKAITLDGSGRIDMNNKSVTIGGAVSGSGDLTILNSTTRAVVTSTGNTYSGGTTIDNVREVRVAAGDSLGTGDITLKNGGTLKNNNNWPTFNQNIILGEGGGKFEAGWSKGMTFNGVISGDALTITADSGEARLYNTANTYTNGTTILGNIAAKTGGSLGTGALTFDNNAKLRNDNSNIDLGTRDITIESGGATIQVGWTGKRIISTGVIDGTGKLTVANDSSALWLGGAANTYSGGTEIQGAVWTQSDQLGTGDVTLNNVHGGNTRGLLKNWDSNTELDNNIIVSANGGHVQAGWNKNLSLNGALSGSGDLTILADSGTVYLNGDSSGYTGLLSLEDGANLGGSGTVNGDLTVTAGGTLAFSTTDTLTVGGTVTLDSTFGVDDLIGISSGTANGTYTLIAGDVSASFIAGFENIGLGNAYDLGDGKSAYFEEGSLQVTVIPEPATLGLLAAFGGSILFIRRRFRI